jgi:hypothetical protein
MGRATSTPPPPPEPGLSVLLHHRIQHRQTQPSIPVPLALLVARPLRSRSPLPRQDPPSSAGWIVEPTLHVPLPRTILTCPGALIPSMCGPKMERAMWIPRQPPVRGRCGERRRTLTSGGALCLLAAALGRHCGGACWRVAPYPWLGTSPTRSARPRGPKEGPRPSTRQRIGLCKHPRSRPGKANYAQAQTKIDGIFDPTPVGSI